MATNELIIYVEVKKYSDPKWGDQAYVVEHESINARTKRILAVESGFTKFSDLVFIDIATGDRVHPGPSCILHFFEVNLWGVNFKGQDLRHLHFHNCYFSQLKLGGAKLLDVTFTACHLQAKGLVKLSPPLFAKLFTDDFEVLNINNIEYGRVIIFNKNRVVCGCRYFTIDQALKHWSLGSHSGGSAFAGAIIQTIHARYDIDTSYIPNRLRKPE